MKVTLLIPCLNESETIDSAVVEAKKYGGKYFKKDFEVLVSDNGSTDGTVDKLQRIKNIRIINTPIRGYGAALHYGILSAHGTYVIFADADLSYNFKDIEKFIKYLNSDYDLILGSRIKGKIDSRAMPYLNRYIGTPILTFLIQIIYGINTSDCNSGFRAVKRSFYESLNMKNSGMEWASELLIKSSLMKGKYDEVPIHFRKDQRHKQTHLKRWEDGWRHLKVIILLKPLILLVASFIVVIIGIVFLPISLFTTLAMFLMAEFLVLSFLIAVKLEAVINSKTNRISFFLDKMPFVLGGIIMTFVVMILLFTISDKHLFTKYILLFQVSIYNLWVFFLETIKTHLVNPLPNKIK